MPSIPHKNSIAVLKTIKDDLQTSTGITAVDKDSKARVLADVFVEEMLDLRQDQQAAEYANQVSNAKGKDLDALGESRGVPRKRISRARSTKAEQNFMFYVDSGTFGDINGAASITIPDGTVVDSVANANELGSRIEFRTVGIHVLANSSALAFISVEGVELGPINNVGALVIRTHRFTNYTDYSSRSLKVLNTYPVINGRAEEVDEVYRYRILQHYNRVLQNSNTRLQLQSLDVPGVLNSKVEPGYFGIGTAAVIVTGPEWITTGSVLEAVQAKLEETRTPGMDAIAVGATEVRFDFRIELRLSRTLTEQEKSRLKAEVNRILLKYFRKSSLGSTIDFEQILRYVQKNVSPVVSFQDTASDRVFKRIFVRRGYSSDALDERDRVLGTSYILGSNEFGALGELDFRFV